jgi:hypothetical protein
VTEPKGFLSLRARIVMGVLLALGVGGFVYAFAGLAPPSEQKPGDSAVHVVYPKPGDRVLRQDTLYIELDPDYTGRIELVDGVDVRQSVEFIDGLNRYSYTPDKDSPTGILKPGRRCATAYFWPRGEPESTGRSYDWCFSVH